MTNDVTRSSWRCASCLSRGFATTRSARAVGPESPNYIAIPETPQQNKSYLPHVKGILPIPRKIFGHGAAQREGLRKAGDEQMDLKTKTPTRPRNAIGPHAEHIAYKAKMADMRRQNFRQGLKSLRDRRVITAERNQKRSRYNQRHREESLHRPEREDERLTNPSVDASITTYLCNRTLPDPKRASRVAAMQKTNDDFLAVAKDQRLDALHTMYMNARDFIVNQDQLDAAIDNQFGTEEQPRLFGAYQISTSIWSKGPQLSAMDMLRQSMPAENAGLSSSGTTAEQLTSRRMKRIAEALTGGKMD